jgi:cytochrome c-type biogenesis protein CcmH/NrfG
MSCSGLWPIETAERYLRRELDEEAAAAFEDHFFSCDECFASLQDLRALHDGLARTPVDVEVRRWGTRRVVWLVAAAAVLVLGSAGSFRLLRTGAVRSPEQAPAVSASLPTTAETLLELARVDPPRWEPVRLRGPQDEAARRFGEAMKRYGQGDWNGALPGLREAARLDPKSPATGFYLGACALQAGRTGEAIGSLARTVALGDTPFVEEARYYLAKAHLRSGDVAAAREELRKVVAARGERREAARDLLSRLDAVTARSP